MLLKWTHFFFNWGIDHNLTNFHFHNIQKYIVKIGELCLEQIKFIKYQDLSFLQQSTEIKENQYGYVSMLENYLKENSFLDAISNNPSYFDVKIERNFSPIQFIYNILTVWKFKVMSKFSKRQLFLFNNISSIKYLL